MNGIGKSNQFSIERFLAEMIKIIQNFQKTKYYLSLK